MAGVTVKFEADKTLKDLKGYSAKNIIATERLIKEIGFEIDLNAKKGSPVDTGRLMASIHPEFKDTGGAFNYTDEEGGSFNGSLINSPTSPLEVFVGTNVKYASDQEDKHHFLLRAWEKGKRNFLTEIKREFKK